MSKATFSIFIVLAVGATVFLLLSEFELNTLYSFVSSTAFGNGVQEVVVADVDSEGRRRTRAPTKLSVDQRTQEDLDSAFDPAPRTSDVPYNELDPLERYFIYSPTGGLSNQLIELAIALEICTLTQRSLIAPMIGRHSSGFRAHEALQASDLFPMDRILDFELLQNKVRVKPLNVSVPIFIKTMVNPEELHTIFHPYKMGWTESDIMSKMVGVPQRILYLRGAEMYHPWFPAAKTNELRLFVRFAPELRKRALDIVQQTFPTGAQGNRGFNAMHIRLGDYTKRWPVSISARSSMITNKAFNPQVTDKTLPLYLASDEPLNQVFAELRKRARVVSTNNLSPELLQDYRELFPPSRIRLDMVGVLDQLICSQAQSFVSTEFSTFSESIRLIRSHRQQLFPESYREREVLGEEDSGDALELSY